MAINTQKFLPQGKKGGTLTVLPKATLAPVKPSSSDITKVEGVEESPILVIKTKLIKIEDLLKGTLAAEKKAADEKRKQQEQEDRSKQEQDVEKTPKSKEKGIKIPVPGEIKSFWGNIKKYIGTVLFGWLALQLLPLLPKLMPIVKFLASTAEFIINIGGKILNGLVTFIDWGYKAVGATEKWIGDKFGEDAAEKFNSFTGILTKTMNLVLALGIAASAMAGKGRGLKGRKGPRRGPLNQLKRSRTKIKRFFDPKRADKLKRVKNIKKIRADRLRRVDRFGRLKKFAKAKKFVKGAFSRTREVIGGARGFGSNILQKGRGFGSNIVKKGRIFLQGSGDTIVKVGKNVFNSLPDFNKLGKQLGGTLTNAYNNSSTWVKKRFDNVVDISKSLKSKYDNALGAAGDAFNKMKKGAQEAVMKKVLEPVMEFLQPLIKKLKGMGGTIMKTLQKIPGFDQITKVLQKFGGEGSQGLMKKLGGKAIPIIGGIVNMGFAYDRLSKGDSIGGLIEGVSGLLDLSGLLGFAPGPMISMGLDGYMFARDFVPQIQQGEEAAVNKLGLSGFKKNIDNIFSKLPGIGEIVKMITGGDKEDKENEGFKNVTNTDLGGMTGLSGSGETFGGQGGSSNNGSSNNIVSTNNSLSNKVDGISGYSDDGEEIYVIKNKSSSKLSDNSNKEEKVVALSSGGGSGSDSTASLYRG